MAVSRNAAFIKTDKNAVMVFRVLVKCFNVDEMLDYITRYETLPCKIAE